MSLQLSAALTLQLALFLSLNVTLVYWLWLRHLPLPSDLPPQTRAFLSTYLPALHTLPLLALCANKLITKRVSLIPGHAPYICLVSLAYAIVNGLASQFRQVYPAEWVDWAQPRGAILRVAVVCVGAGVEWVLVAWLSERIRRGEGKTLKED
jgi:hypothetical protein